MSAWAHEDLPFEALLTGLATLSMRLESAGLELVLGVSGRANVVLDPLNHLQLEFLHPCRVAFRHKFVVNYNKAGNDEI